MYQVNKKNNSEPILIIYTFVILYNTLVLLACFKENNARDLCVHLLYKYNIYKYIIFIYIYYIVLNIIYINILYYI